MVVEDARGRRQAGRSAQRPPAAQNPAIAPRTAWVVRSWTPTARSPARAAGGQAARQPVVCRALRNPRQIRWVTPAKPGRPGGSPHDGRSCQREQPLHQKLALTSLYANDGGERTRSPDMMQNIPALMHGQFNTMGHYVKLPLRNDMDGQALPILPLLSWSPQGLSSKPTPARARIKYSRETFSTTLALLEAGDSENAF